MSNQDRFHKLLSTTEARKDIGRRSVRAFTSVFASSGAEFFLRIASTAVLARLISPEHFGLFMMVTAILAIADQFRDMGLSTATIQRADITHNEVSNLFWVNVGVGSFLTITFFASSHWVAQYYADPRISDINALLSLNFFLGSLTVQHEALLTRRMQHGKKSLVRLLAFLLSTVVSIVMAYADYGYWSLAWRELSRYILLVLGTWWACPWVPGLPDRSTSIRGLLKFGSGLTLTYMLGVLSSSIDRLLLGRFVGPDSVAVYRQPYQLVVTPMSQFMSPLYQVSLPSLSMVQNDPDKFRRYFLRIVVMVAMASMPLSVFLALFSADVTLLVLGPKWESSIPFFTVFAIGGFLRSISSVPGFVCVSRGVSRALLALGVAQSILMIVLMFLGLKWGAIGVALADLASILLLIGPRVHFSLTGSPVHPWDFVKALIRPTVSSLGMGAILYLLKSFFPADPGMLRLSTFSLLAVAVFAATSFLLPGGKAEVLSIFSDLKAGISRRKSRTAQVPA